MMKSIYSRCICHLKIHIQISNERKQEQNQYQIQINLNNNFKFMKTFDIEINEHSFQLISIIMIQIKREN